MNIKKITYVLIVITSVIMFTQVVYAGAFTPTDVKPIYDSTGGEEARSLGGIIIGAIQVVGSVISVAVLIVIGIKYLIASVEERAHYKKIMIPYLVGAILLFGACNIASLIFNMATNIK